ncbi:MAG: cobalamin-independent methionine synthase II family protein [Boseongicola sp.]
MKKMFPASVVGSMPRPAEVRELVARDATDTLEMDDAIRAVVAVQEDAGLDVITDGEWRRRSYIGVIAELAHGFDVGINPADGRPWTVVTGRLEPKTGGFIAAEAKFLRSITDRQIKVTLPAPALLGERVWDADASSGAYPDPKDFVRDCVPVLRREIELLVDAGVDIIQIDDPHLCLFVDQHVRATYDDPEAAANFSVDMVNAVVEGISGPTMALHLCRRAGARARGESDYQGGYATILSQINRLDIDHLTIEFSTPGSGDISILKQFNPEFEIGLGCVGVTPGDIDPLEKVVERVEEALKWIGAERVTLNPDCGFAPGSAAEVDLEEVAEKLRIEVMAAQHLRKRHGGT